MKNTKSYCTVINVYVYFFCSIVSFLSISCSFAGIKTSYYYNSQAQVSIQSVSSLYFETFQNKVNRGFNNGSYWIKIENDTLGRLLEITSARIKNIQGFSNGSEVQPLEDFSFPTFDLEPNQTIYLQVYCEKEACIPIATKEKKEIIKLVQREFLFYGLYYGFALLIITLNFFYLFNFREITFLYYGLFLLGVMFSLLYRDGLIYSFFRNEWWQENGEVVFHFSSVCLGSMFASVYLRHEIHFPRLHIYTLALAMVMVLLFLIHLITRQFSWFVFAEMVGISMLAVYWVSSVMLFGKNTFYAFFSIAYSLILILAIDFFILPLLGLPNLGITTFFMKTASVFEMLILSYAVVYRMKILKQENSENQQALFHYTTQIEKLEDELSKLKLGEQNKITNANLSAREVEILTMISNGIPTKEIADKLFISINTVKYHIKKLYDKLEISTRQEAKIKAADFQIVQ